MWSEVARHGVVYGLLATSNRLRTNAVLFRFHDRRTAVGAIGRYALAQAKVIRMARDG